MRNYLFVCLLAFLPFFVGAAETPQPTGPLSATPYDFIYVGDSRPILYRLHVFVEGKPLQAAWEEFTLFVFKSLDLDGDGVLTKDEAERTPPTSVLFAGNQFGGFATPNMPQLDRNNDGKVSLEELRAFYRANGAGPFQIQLSTPQQTQVRFLGGGGAGRSQANSAEALNASLFQLLDTDKDGKLSASELQAAPALLLKRDANDDETVSSSELLGNAPPSNDYTFAVQELYMEGGQRSAGPNFLAVTPGETRALGQQLLTRYTRAGAIRQGSKNPTRESLGLDEATFQRLDADGNGELDAEELARFANRPADVEVILRLGRIADGKPALEVVSAADRPNPLAANLKTKAGTATLDLGNTRIDLTMNAAASAPGPRVAVNLKQIYKMQFSNADQDNNGYLDLNEVRRNGVFAGMFRAMDRDGDGKVFEKEMLAYLDELEGLQAKALAGCCSLNISDQGNGLFDLLDTNRDGRLSVREMRNAIKQIENLDRDGDQMIAKDEIPRNYQLSLNRGGIGMGQTSGRIVVAAPGFGGTAERVPTPTAGPVWFRKMDRNGDGDVSRREFLGTDEEFQRLDTDGDGLISREEAEKAKK